MPQLQRKGIDGLFGPSKLSVLIIDSVARVWYDLGERYLRVTAA